MIKMLFKKIFFLKKQKNILVDQDLINFQKGIEIEQNGYTIQKIITDKSDDWWEYNHQFIQWVFPLQERSKYNRRAPVVVNVDKYKTPYMILAYKRFLRIIQNRNYIIPGNHWCLRATRVLKSLKLFGYKKELKELYEWLIEQVNIYPDLKYSKIYWDNVYNNKEENR